jgi:hypothetical protein
MSAVTPLARTPVSVSSRTVLTERLTPLQIFLLSNIVWLALLIIAPVSPRWPPELLPLLLYASCVVCILAGLALPHLMRMQFTPVPTDRRHFELLFKICLYLGAIGLGLKIIDLIVYRNVEVSLDFIENRKASEIAQTSALSSAAAFLQPYGVSAFVLTCVATKLGIHQRLDPRAMAVGLGVLLLPVVFGSRSTIMIAGIEVGFLTLLLLRKLTQRMIALGLATTVGFMFVFAIIFATRLQLAGVDYRFAARYSAYTLVTPLNEDYLAVIEAADYATGSLLAAFASILQYILSGAFEFFYLVELKSENFSLGGRQFFIIPKIINVINGVPATTMAYTDYIETPRVGVFQTLYGPMYIDFGYYCMFFAFAFGVVVELVRMRVIAGDYSALPLHLFFIMTIALAPIESGLGMNAGIIAAFSYASLFAFAALMRLFVSRR